MEQIVERYLVPNSIDEAAQVLAGDSSCSLFAGSTDLLPQFHGGKKQLGRTLVNLKHVEGLAGITQQGKISIGALTTISSILHSDLLKDHAAVLVDTANCFASDQVRNAATLGGNICNASPAGDMIIPLLLLEAEVVLVAWENNRRQTRTLPLDQFFAGPGKTKRQPNEILTTITFKPCTNQYQIFRKFGTRPALDISVVSVGFTCNKKQDQLRDVKLAFGAVAATPIRAYATEKILENQKLDADVMLAAALSADREISPISDTRASEWYRRQLIQKLFTKVLYHVSEQDH